LRSSHVGGVKQFASAGDEFLCYAEQGKIEDYLTLYNNLKELVVSEGPFDGLIAFSEGAAVAASLIVDRIRSAASMQPSPFHFKCAIFFCGANPVEAEAVKRGEIIYLNGGKHGRIIDIPTAHIWTRDDNVHPGFGESLSGLCEESVMEEYIHALGHTIPGAQSGDGVFETVRVIRRTLERAAEFSL
jgi:hypothetical protein